jgi:hypothetical protein
MNGNSSDDERRYLHLITLLTVSSAMVGVCITAIGLIEILHYLNSTEWIIDDFLAIASMLFLVTSILSFVGMRTRWGQRRTSLIRILDVLFCLGLSVVFVATALLTWMMI